MCVRISGGMGIIDADMFARAWTYAYVIAFEIHLYEYQVGWVSAMRTWSTETLATFYRAVAVAVLLVLLLALLLPCVYVSVQLCVNINMCA